MILGGGCSLMTHSACAFAERHTSDRPPLSTRPGRRGEPSKPPGQMRNGEARRRFGRLAVRRSARVSHKISSPPRANSSRRPADGGIRILPADHADHTEIVCVILRVLRANSFCLKSPRAVRRTQRRLIRSHDLLNDRFGSRISSPAAQRAARAQPRAERKARCPGKGPQSNAACRAARESPYLWRPFRSHNANAGFPRASGLLALSPGLSSGGPLGRTAAPTFIHSRHRRTQNERCGGEYPKASGAKAADDKPEPSAEACRSAAFARLSVGLLLGLHFLHFFFRAGNPTIFVFPAKATSTTLFSRSIRVTVMPLTVSPTLRMYL
jgi:hypothetical protein